MWILLSPLLFLMAVISTVESLSVYYVQLVCFGLISIAGILTGFGYIFSWPWVTISSRLITRVLVIYFVGSWILMALFFAYHEVVSI